MKCLKTVNMAFFNTIQVNTHNYYTSNCYCPIRLLHYRVINLYIDLGSYEVQYGPVNQNPIHFKNDGCRQF